MRAVIIDDMDLARASLRADLQDHCPEIEIVGEASGVVEAAKLLKNLETDLIFLDIHMGDGEGFDLLDILPEHNARVIFTTASDEHAIKAFQYAAIDYLLKPISPDLLVKAVAKVKTLPSFSKENQETLKEDNRNNLVLSTSDELRVVSIEDIVRCKADGNYTHFVFNDNTKLLVTRTLKEFDKLLQEKGFLRVHQSHLVNTSFIKAYIKTEGGYLLLHNDEHVPVSVRKKPMVMKAVAKIK
jgi:two-component system LytT family response regulator